ncbi:MAG: class IV adenylate cyclase [Blastocatellia bacterium]|nr:MAG: class IV adenylate cyclase [Blastocatellia bacterium]
MLEIEKKYRLTQEQKQQVVERLREVGARSSDEEFEENTLYSSDVIDLQGAILRLRRTDKSAWLTRKRRLSTSSSIKHQEEFETGVDNPEAMVHILTSLGFKPMLIYEKFRRTWTIDDVEVVIDRLPFGLFMEIEGSEEEIESAERKLGIEGFEAEHATYPQLTSEHGKRSADLIEARFE